MKETPTLKQIAQELGLSIGTVQRALHNKGGYSEETQKRILDAAARCGYTANPAASALRRAPINLAAVFPAPEGVNRYFFNQVWQGIDKACSELSLYHLSVARYYAEPDSLQAVDIAESLLQSDPPIDGLITNEINDPRFNSLIETFAQRKIPVFLVNAAKENSTGRYYASANQHAGKLAADILSIACSEKKGKILLLGGSHTNIRQATRVKDFFQQMNLTCPDIFILTIHSFEKPFELKKLIRESCDALPDVIGLYAVSARETLSMCQALQTYKPPHRLITVGTDAFPELIPFFQDGTLTASVYQYPAQQSFTAVKTLVGHVLQTEFHSEPLLFPIAAVFQSNADVFCHTPVLIRG